MVTDGRSLTRYAWLAIAAAVATMALKGAAWALTGSVGLLSDAAESVVNLIAATALLVALRIALRPADEGHPYGHEKAEYFAAGVEGAMIVFAALTISAAAIDRLLDPTLPRRLDVGVVVAASASLVNLGVAVALTRAGRRTRSPALEASGRHLMTDVWTSAGVVAGVGAVAVTGWEPLDPLIALAVAVNIVVAGLALLRRSAGGLMDRVLPDAERARVDAVLDRFRHDGVEFHAVRTRQAGRRAFVSLHVLVPGDWSVLRGHNLLERIEAELRTAVPEIAVLTHLEPLEDTASYADVELDRGAPEPSRERRKA